MNESLYEECIAACDLIPDILSFKSKDLYGKNIFLLRGINLLIKYLL
jgi:hypothetical protein